MPRHLKLDEVAVPIADIVYSELTNQPWFARYKGTLLMVLQALAWVAGAVPVMLAHAPAWVIAITGGVGALVTILINRFTKDGVTPSMAPRLEHRATVEHKRLNPPALPVYTGATSTPAP